nr:immunoglobulin light chain junction region [Macaca mulatta]
DYYCLSYDSSSYWVF